MKAGGEGSKTYQPALSVQVDYWCVDGITAGDIQSQMHKTKHSQTHPVLPLVLSLDENQTIGIWNYELKRLIWSRTLVQMQQEISAASSTSQQEQQLSTQTPQSVIAQSLSRLTLHATRRSTLHSQNLCVLSAYQTLHDATPASASTAKAATQALGELKHISFADSQFIQHETGIHVAGFPGRPHKAHQLVILFDSMVVVHDYCLSQTVVLGNVALSNRKPTAVEFLDDIRVAIGCSDGTVRVWNLDLNKEEFCFALGGSPKEVSLLKTVPLSVCSQRYYSIFLFSIAIGTEFCLLFVYLLVVVFF
jgi:WD40 repeat protein